MATMTECPNHAGAFDCSPFCALCEGAQEVPTTITENTTAEKESETMITKNDLTIDRTSEGATRISALVNGYLETRRYLGYSKRKAIALFLEEVN